MVTQLPVNPRKHIRGGYTEHASPYVTTTTAYRGNGADTARDPRLNPMSPPPMKGQISAFNGRSGASTWKIRCVYGSGCLPLYRHRGETGRPFNSCILSFFGTVVQ